MTPKILKAFSLVYELQPDMMRKFTPLPNGKELYWTHLFSVYKSCIYWGNFDENLLLGAILHDVIEDTEYTFDKLKVDFGDEVAQIVLLCTKKTDYKLFNEGDQDEYFERMLGYANKDIRVKALKIKLADRLDNLIGSTFIKDKSTREKYLEETEKYYTKIAEQIDKKELLYSAIEYAKTSLQNNNG